MKQRNGWLKALVSLVAIMLLATTVGAAPKSAPIVSLSVTQSEFSADQDVLVTVTIHNPGKSTARVLRWFTPEAGVEESLFAVTRDGEPVAYTGAHYKRPAAVGNDYVSLKSGASLVRTVNLGEFYDLSQSGQYEVAYSVVAFNLFDEKGNAFKFRDSLSSTSIKLKVDGRAPLRKPTPAPTPAPGSTVFNRCTVDQQNQLITARANATGYADNAKNYLVGNNQGSRYTTWFGVFNATRYDTVKNNFVAISNAWHNAGVTFDCGCKQNYYAYVYSNQPYKIFLCKVFWTAPATGTDSKAGTLIHEMSHFDVVAGTDDIVYGTTGAMNLANTNPADAIRNADNHEYFAENTPPLP